MPLIWFMRSVHQPWLEQGGDLLARFGSGAVLVAFSATLLVVGRLRMQPTLFHAGLQGLVAHGAAALVSQLLKHTIGRPRPRVTQEGEFQFEPSLVSGFDSFPSGHASASFAVATVLARHFPRLGWVGYLVAALIACSRVWRGSHFPTDVVSGAAIGVLIGALLAYSYLDWLTVFSRMLTKLALALSAVFALFWPMVQSSSDHQGALWLTGTGMVAILVGLGLRWRAAFDGQSLDAGPWSRLLLGAGLALSTGLWLVSAAACMAGSAWMMSQGQAPDRSGANRAAAQSSCSPWVEVAIGLALMLTFAALQRVKGILPIL
jgi:membrane-associated phospholipid phosphatase